MPPKRCSIPGYRLHKPSGQARVIIDQRHIYLGKYGTPASWGKYNRLIAERLNGRDQVQPPWEHGNPRHPHLSVSELILAYWRFAQDY